MSELIQCFRGETDKCFYFLFNQYNRSVSPKSILISQQVIFCSSFGSLTPSLVRLSILWCVSKLLECTKTQELAYLNCVRLSYHMTHSCACNDKTRSTKYNFENKNKTWPGDIVCVLIQGYRPTVPVLKLINKVSYQRYKLISVLNRWSCAPKDWVLFT